MRAVYAPGNICVIWHASWARQIDVDEGRFVRAVIVALLTAGACRMPLRRGRALRGPGQRSGSAIGASPGARTFAGRVRRG